LTFRPIGSTFLGMQRTLAKHFDKAIIRYMSDKAPVPVVVADSRARIIRVNKAMCQFLGYSQQALMRKSVPDITFPDDRDNTAQVLKDIWTAAGVVRRLEKRYVHKSGRIVWGEVSVRVVPESLNSPAFTIAHILDITARKKAEIALKVSEARYRQLHEGMMDAFVSVSMDGRLQDFNHVYLEMLGYERDEILTKTYRDITPVKWHAREAAIVRNQVLARGYSDIYEKEYRRKDGTIFPVELRTLLLRDDAGKPEGMWAMVRDVTARKRLEQSLLKTNVELERKVRERTLKLRKLAGDLTQAEHKERRRIAYVLHEDIQQRLVALRYQVEAIIQGNPPETTLVPARRMLGELEHIVQMTRSLSSDLRPPVLYELGLKSALDWLAGDLKQKFGLEVEVRAKDSKCHLSDDLRIFAFEAVRELLLNVVKHAGVKRASVQVNPCVRGYRMITVKDKGGGFVSKRSLESRGALGLFSIHERASAFGGSFKVSSERGKGTVCTLTLPES